MRTRDDVMWAAGLFEGEGCLTRRHSAKSPTWSTWTLAVRMTDEDVVRKFQAALGLGVVNGPYMNGTRSIKPIWTCAVNGAEKVYAACMLLYPFLGTRRQKKIEDFVAWFKTYQRRRKGSNETTSQDH